MACHKKIRAHRRGNYKVLPTRLTQRAFAAPTLIQANPSFLILAMMVVRVVATWRNILVFLSHQSSQPTSIIRDFKGPLGMCGV